MMWGVAAGLPAGVIGGVFARAVCLPTAVLIGWIAAVARWSSHAPLGTLGPSHVVILGALVATGAAVRSRRGRLALVTAAALVLVQPAMALATTGGRHSLATELVPGTRLWRNGGATVLVVDSARSEQLLRAVHAAEVRRIDVLVVTKPSRSTSAAVASLLARVPARAVLGTDPLRAPTEIDVGSIAVHVRPATKGIEVDVARR
jgi:beta-lactamase superfamily II metal-dependent hydrolase